MTNDFIIEVNHVSKQFEDGKFALNDVSLQVKKGEFVTILGPSGCGKTTLLRCIAGFQVASSGDILLKGEDVTSTPPYKRPVNTVFQKYALFPHLNVFDNVAYGCRINRMYRKHRQLIWNVQKQLQAVGLWEEVRGRVRTPASRLSIGQQQRLCLARSLAVEPQYILADEATSALDPISSKRVEDLFVSLKQDYTILMVTHTLHQALRIADNVVFMYLGEVVESGPAEMLFHHPQQELTQKYLSGVFS